MNILGGPTQGENLGNQGIKRMIAETRYTAGTMRWKRTGLGGGGGRWGALEAGSSRSYAVTQVACLAELASGGEAATSHAAQGTELLTACLDALQLRLIRMLVFFL
jgi:hypothetical protein